MTNDKGILIQNIYYMLTYAFKILQQSNYEDMAAEEFENIHDMFAAILSKGIARQLKQGLYREYIFRNENLPMLKGKLNIQETIGCRLQRKQVLSCEYDELSENNLLNQILKTTTILLCRHAAIKQKYRLSLKKLLLFFDQVDVIQPSAICWSRIRFHKNNGNYKMLLHICYFVLEGLLLTTEEGSCRMVSFLDEQRMSHLYEKFVLEYYRRHHPSLKAAPSQVPWNLDDDSNAYLPVMQTDITLRNNGKVLIIDTKYYAHTMQTRAEYDSHTLHSSNLYQIFTYVKNLDKTGTGNVSGLLLYARTDELITPDCSFSMGGNKISVKTLDLNVPFTAITAQLDSIADTFLSQSR